MNNTTDTLNMTIQNSTEISTEIVSNTFIGLTTPFTMNPLIDIIIIALIAALFTTILNKYLTDQVAIKALRKEMKKNH